MNDQLKKCKYEQHCFQKYQKVLVSSKFGHNVDLQNHKEKTCYEILLVSILKWHQQILMWGRKICSVNTIVLSVKDLGSKWFAI